MKRRTTLSVTPERETEIPLLDEPLDFDSAVRLFLDEQKVQHRTKSTLEWYTENLHTLRIFLERQGVATAPRQITTRTLKQHYILHMLDTLGLSPVTFNGRIRTVKSFFKFLHQESTSSAIQLPR